MITPYNYEPLKWHLNVLNNSARFKVIVAHRKARKTTLAINELIRWSNAVRGVYWYVAPYLQEAKRTIWQEPDMLPKYVPPEIWKNRNNSELYVPFPNGSLLYVMGADNPKGLRGPNPKGVILDEYDYMRPETWSAVIQPILMVNPNAWAWFVGTYDGVKDLHAKFNFAKNRKDWWSMILPADKSGLMTPEQLQEAREGTTQAFFDQEYMCLAIEGASSFFRNIGNCVYPEYVSFQKGHRYQLGVDLAKYNDWTVLTPFDLTEFRALRNERFNQIDYTLQKARIEATYLRFEKPKTYIDSTGVGEPIFDDLVARGIKNIEPYYFTEATRKDLLVSLQILIEQGKIKIPKDENLVNELNSFKYHLGQRGKTKIMVPEGQNDDCVMSLALSTWQIPQNPLRVREENERDVLKQFDFFRKKVKRASNFLTGSPYLR